MGNAKKTVIHISKHREGQYSIFLDIRYTAELVYSGHAI